MFAGAGILWAFFTIATRAWGVEALRATLVVALLGPMRAALFPALVPVLAVLAGVPVAGEWPEPVQWLGLAVVVAGLPLAMGVLGRR